MDELSSIICNWVPSEVWRLADTPIFGWEEFSLNALSLSDEYELSSSISLSAIIG
jgi:hypothetical protein